MGFFADIKKRRFFQIVAAYAAAGFVALQAVDQLVQQNVLPAFTYGLTLWWYGVGFLAAMLIGWFHGERGAQKAPLFEIVALSMIAVFLLGLTGAQVTAHVSERAARAAAAESELDLRRVAIAYLYDLSPNGANQHIGDALTEDLISELSRVRGLDVISRNGVAPFRGQRIPVDSIAGILRAGTVVAGTVEEVDDLIRVNIRLHDGQSGAEFRRVTLERPSSELFAAREEVAEATARFLREWLGEEVRLRQRQRDTDNLATWALVQRAERARKDAEELVNNDDVTSAFALFQRADQLLEQAETVDPRWAEPIVLRGEIAYRRSRLEHGPHDAEPWIHRGLGHAERALALEPNHAKALELRGTLRYWWYLLPLIPDPDEREALFRRARADLERAVRLDPTLASAHSTLSHLYAWIHEMSSSLLAAQRAYEEDAYLATADVVLWRLVTTNYEQEAFEPARRWCDIGAERFPADFRFLQCQLLLMTTRAMQPDIERGWRLVARIDSLAPEGQRLLHHANSLIFLGGAIARAGMPDSADVVLRRARAKFHPDADPRREIYLNEAAMRAVTLGEVDEAIDLLKSFAAVNRNYDFEHMWWWRGVRNHPRYGELTAFQIAH